MPRLTQLVMLCLYCCSAVTADSPQSRSEWLKYVSLFFNREWEAEATFRRIRTGYQDLKRAAQARANALGNRKVVVWVYKGWDADFVVSKAPYKLAYVQVGWDRACNHGIDCILATKQVREKCCIAQK